MKESPNEIGGRRAAGSRLPAMKFPVINITWRTALLSWVVSLATLLVFVLIILPWQKRAFQQSLESKAHGVAVSLRDVAAGAAVNEDYSSVIDHCREMLAGDQSLAYLVITKNDGFSLIQDRQGWRSENDAAPEWRPAERVAGGGIGFVPLFQRRVYHYSQPFDYSGIQWGWIHVGLGLDAYEQNLGNLYRLVVVLGLACAVLSLVASGLYARQLVRPLLDLQAIVRRVATGDLTARAATTRDDELGQLATSVNTMTGSLLRRDEILGSVQFAAQRFLGTTQWRGVIDGVLARIGQAAGVSRAFVFEQQTEPGAGPFLRFTHEWSGPAVPTKRSDPVLQHLSLDEPVFARWVKLIQSGQIIATRLADAPEEARALFARQNIRALLVVPVLVDDVWWGFIGLSDSVHERTWSDAERDSLQAVADMIGAAVSRQRTQDALLEAKATLEQRVRERTRELSEANTRLTREVAERLQAEQALVLSEERFSKAFQANPIPLAILSFERQTILDANEGFQALTGRAITELVGRTPEELELWAEPENGRRIFAQLRQNPAVRQLPGRFRKRTGAVSDLLLSFALIELGGARCLLAIAQDITEQLQLEKQLRHSQKMEAVGQLAAGIAHDFNNMLTVIQGNASIALLDLGGSPEQPLLEGIVAAAQRSARLVRQLLTFSHKQILEANPIQVKALLAPFAEMLPRMLSEQIAVTFTVTDNLPPITLDSGMIEQLLMNLAVNARDAMPRGGRLTISARLVEVTAAAHRVNAEARAGRFLVLGVGDTGCGIPPEHLARIFEPFYTTKPVGKGTGLGLATVYAIAQQHRGWIEVQSEVNVGTTFLIYLPFPEESVAELVAKSGETMPRSHGNETIFVVEDEETVRQCVVAILKKHGYTVITAGNGVEALAVWKQGANRFDLLLTDIVMPEGVTGLELAQQLLADQPRLKVILSSGYSSELMNTHSPFLMRHRFLAKPYEAGELLQAVREVLDQSPPAA